ncbi:MAG: O-antigen ligase family protein [Deltaproteobacteria bacterium]|nr:O-antigen ligase family protein [Deltaproteobacteria bacterium]
MDSNDQSVTAFPPWIILAILGALIGLVAAFQPSQGLAAIIILSLGALLAGLHPRNGLYLTILVCPFFLGEPQDPFFYLLEGLGGVTILSWLIHRFLASAKREIPHRWLLYLAAFLIVVNPPLNLKEIWFALRSLDDFQIFYLLVEGRKHHDLFALRSLILHLGGLLFLAACLDELRPRDIKFLGLGLLLVSLGVCLFGLLTWLGWLPLGRSYLSLNLQGISDRHGQLLLTATAFNRQYLNELLIFTAMAVGGLAIYGRGWLKLLAAPFGALVLVCLGLTGQRTPFASLGGMALVAAGLVIWSVGWRRWRLGAGIILGVAAASAGFLALDAVVGTDILAGRFLGLASADAVTGPGLRPQVWGLAWTAINDFFITGTGPGTFRLLAPEWAAKSGLDFHGPLSGIVGTAHNVYLHWFSELGLVSLAAILGLGAVLIRDGLRAFKWGDERTLAGLILVSLAGQAVFGVFQHIFYVTAIALLILAALAALTRLAPADSLRPRRPSRKVIIVAVVLLAVVAGLKTHAIVERPFRQPYRAGFHLGEFQPDGKEAWWTSGREGVMSCQPAHPYLIVPLCFPNPLVFERPQKVRVWVDEDHQANVVLNDANWRQIKLDLRDFRGQSIYVRFQTEYAFFPFFYDESPDHRLLGVMVKDPIPADE